MSLKAFHILFILICTALGAALVLWSVRQYRASGATEDLFLGVTGLVMVLALVPYGIWFLRKLRHLSYL
ncbi:MAG: hypothetical protein ACE5GE_06290 [Phycisphaerae bacterium]